MPPYYTASAPHFDVWPALLTVAVFIHATEGMDMLYDTHGPTFVNEPPPKVEFTNSNGGRLDCSVSGNPPPNIEWVGSDNVVISSIPGIRLVRRNGSIVFPPFEAEVFRQDVHWAVYRCVASNSVGKIVSRDSVVRAVVNQHYEPEVQSPGGFLGNNVIIRCTVPSFIKEFVTVTSWLQEPSFNIYPSTVSDGKYHMLPTGELMILNITRADTQRTYRCRTHHYLTQEGVVSNNVGRIQLTDIRGPVPPILNEKLVMISARIEDTVVLPCVAYANPRPQYRWYYGLGYRESLITEHDRYLVSDGTLVIPSVTEADTGSYYCNASNKEGSEVLEVQLTVTASLQVLIQPIRQTVDLGKQAAFTCIITGFPKTNVYWLKDGAPLRISARIQQTTKESIRIIAIEREDRGMYQCMVKNDIDMAQGASELTLGEIYPQFVYKFIEQTMQPGPSVSLKCSATGNPTPQITWKLDGFPLPQNDRLLIGQYVTVFGDVISHVNISSVKPEDGGEYECVAENRAGSAHHADRLNIYGLPYVRPMQPIAAVAGKELIIKCPVAGYPIEFTVWEKDGVRLPANVRQRVNNNVLAIRDVQRGPDHGTYTCIARNKQNITSQRSVEVRVLVPPKITPFGFGRDLNVGDRTSIQCVVVTGDLPLTFEWVKDNKESVTITSTSTTTGTSTGTTDITVRQYDDFTSALSISSITREHSGNYTCRVSNAAATVTHTAQLRVNVPPRISPFYFEDGVTEGMRTQLMCTASQGDRPFNITWHKDSRILGSGDDDWISISDYAPFSSILTINSVTSSHSGNYTCVVDNQAGKTEYTAHLSVMVPPRWIAEPSDQNVIVGNTVALNCQVDGFPKPLVTWRQAIGTEPGDYRELDYNGKRIQRVENGSLVIHRVGEEHEGYYLCQASNNVGHGLSKVIKLNVYAGPRFKVHSHQETVKRGDAVRLNCEAEGDPLIEITWKAKGHRIDPGFDTRYIIKVSQLPHGTSSELSIDKASLADSAEYTCIARNQYGLEQFNIHLLVQEPPSFPQNIQVTDRTSRSVRVTWSASFGDTPVTSYVIQYKDSKDIWHEQTPQKVVGGDKTTALITGLKPATMYHFRMFAENQLGTSTPSHLIQAMTESEIPAGPPLQVNAEAVSSTQIRVTWQPPDLQLWNGDLLGYNIGYSKEGTDKGFYNWTRVSAVDSAIEEFRLTGLEKFTKYKIVLQAFNDKGDGPASEPVYCQTLEDAPSAPPANIACVASTSQNLQISWDAPPFHLTHGNIVSYKLIYEPTEETNTEAVFSESKITTGRVTVLHGLEPHTNYSIQILATTKAGDGVLSSTIFCMTDETVPEAPEHVKAVTASQNTAVISWLPPSRPNGKIIKYTVYIRIQNKAQSEDVIVKSTHCQYECHYNATGLKQGERYEAWVSASTKVGEGPSTPVVQLKLTSFVPASIISIGRALIVPWKVNVKMTCQSVGIPRPTTDWRLGDQKLHNQPRIELTPEHNLIIQNVQRNNEGNYTCYVHNNQGSDHIIYSLQVQVPPTPPHLITTSVTVDSVQLQWKQGDNGGSPIRGFQLSYRREHGEWEEINVDRRLTTYLLEGLLCGTHYQFRLTAYNKIGSSTPSILGNAKTKGGKPVPAPASVFLKTNVTTVDLILSEWKEPDCPVLYFVIDYREASLDDDWNHVSNNILPQHKYTVFNLKSKTQYRVRVEAHNNAGSTIQEYDFNTLDWQSGNSLSGTAVTDFSEDIPFYLDSFIIIPVIVSVIAISIVVVGACYCFRRRPVQEDISLQESQTTAVMDNKQNLEQREQFYAAVQKSFSTPAKELGGLEQIPEYSEDIYPYATFHLSEHENMASNPLPNVRGHDLRMMEPPPQGKQLRSRLRRKHKSFKSESEEYDSLASDSDTERGTSSRTESSSHLANPGTLPCSSSVSSTSHIGAHRPVHHNFLLPVPGASISTEPSPISDHKRFLHHCKRRRNMIRENGMLRKRRPFDETTFTYSSNLDPPSGFTDGYESCESNYDTNSIKKSHISLSDFHSSCENQDFTIAV